MSFLLPERPIALPGGFRWNPSLVELQAWQAHLLKHPLGLGALRDRARPWDGERWTATHPPVVDEETRAQLFGTIARLRAHAWRCKVPEVVGERAADSKPECYECATPLAGECFKMSRDYGVSTRYRNVTEELVASLEDGVIVGRRALGKALQENAGRIETWRTIVVMSAGSFPKGGSGVRLSRGDGVRVELFLGPEKLVRWRTTYRIPEVGAHSGSWGYLLKVLERSRDISMSDVYVVSRAWWEEHGS